MRKLLIKKVQETAATNAGIYLQKLFEMSMTEAKFKKKGLSKQTECRVSLVLTTRKLNRGYQLGRVLK